MQKFFAALAAALVMAAGLSVVTTTGAQAACPYSNCIDTSTKFTKVPNRVKRNQRATVCLKVTTAGNGTPKGKLNVKVSHARSGKRVYSDSKKYTGGKKCFKTSRLRNTGKHVVTADFKRKAGSAWRNSSSRATFKVRR